MPGPTYDDWKYSLIQYHATKFTVIIACLIVCISMHFQKMLGLMNWQELYNLLLRL